MSLSATHKPHWDRIDTVLLDLDGTLLNLDFDNYFWRKCVPAAYAMAQGLTPDQARAQLLPRFRKWEGQLEWYCIEHWSRELGLDVAQMHRDERAHVGWLPGAEDFLRRLQKMKKRRVLITNAHPETLTIKDEQTGVSQYFDAVFSSHTFRAPKENAKFWQGLRGVEPYDPERTMFVDDSLSVLRAARAAGVRWIYAVYRQPGVEREFSTVSSVAEL